MDLNSLKDQVAGLSLYDIKAGVRKVQNGKRHRRIEPDHPDPIASCHELYGDGGEGLLPILGNSYAMSAQCPPVGSRSNEQRALGGILNSDARNRQRHP